jgi:Fic family protein
MGGDLASGRDLAQATGPMLRTTIPPDHLAARVRDEYLELPGLRLTLWQAQRLYGISSDDALRTFDNLVKRGFLRRGEDGSYSRS